MKESSIKDPGNILKPKLPDLATFSIKDEHGATFQAESCLITSELLTGCQLSPNETDRNSPDIIAFITKALYDAKTKARKDGSPVSTSDLMEDRGRSRAHEEDYNKRLTACFYRLPFSSHARSRLGGRYEPDILSILHGPGA
jgi:hypothetical protein